MVLATRVGFQLVGLAGGQPPAPPERKDDAKRAPAPPIPEGEDGFTNGVHRLDEPQLVPPRASKTPAGELTAEAASHHLSGSVGVEVVVVGDGTVARARVTQSLDATYGLDEAALCAAMRWTFSPAKLDGQAGDRPRADHGSDLGSEMTRERPGQPVGPGRVVRSLDLFYGRLPVARLPTTQAAWMMKPLRRGGRLSVRRLS